MRQKTTKNPQEKKFRLKFLIVISLLILGTFIAVANFFYKKDKDQYEPFIWFGFFNYRINFRDLGKSLNECLGKEQFTTGKIFRSNKNFSGWSCEKIETPNKIYSFNFNPRIPHSYYCEEPNGTRNHGISYNKTFEISEIEKIEKWNNLEFKTTLCSYFKNTLEDLVNHKTFLFHCDVGRDRTGTFAAMLAYMLLEEKNLNSPETINAIECDYEKTSALRRNQKGNMKKFLTNMETSGGVKKFIQEQCEISGELITGASHEFIAEKNTP